MMPCPALACVELPAGTLDTLMYTASKLANRETSGRSSRWQWNKADHECVGHRHVPVRLVSLEHSTLFARKAIRVQSGSLTSVHALDQVL